MDKDCYSSSEISVHVYTCKASENFRNLQELLSFETPVMQSAFEFHHGSCSHVLGNEKVHAYQVPLQIKQAQSYDR